MVGTHGHTSSLDRERPCDHEWSNDRPQGISKDTSAGRGVPAPTPEGRTEPRRFLDIETQEEKVLPISFFVSGLLTSFSTDEIDVCKTFCSNRRLDSSAMQMFRWEETVVRFFLKFFLHTCARSLFWSPFALLGRCI